MSIEEILLKPDSEILRVGFFVKEIIKAWHAITGQQPDACDCQLKNYLRVVRRHYNKISGMKDKIYFDGAYIDINTITNEQKQAIKLQNPILFNTFAIKYGWIEEKQIEKVVEKPQTRQKKAK